MGAPGIPPSEMNPNQQNQPNAPSGNGNRLEQARLIQTGGDSGGLLSEQTLGGSSGSAQSFSSQWSGQGSDQDDLSALGSGLAPSPQQAGGSGSLDTLPGSNLSGALDASAVGFSDALPQGGSQNYFSNYAAGSLVVPAQNPKQRYQTTATNEPVMMRTPNPYNDIPSLYDMYLQASPRPSAPKRFGSDVFENGTRDPQLIPMDLPAGPDYVVGPGDGLAINLWGSVSRRINSTVDREGRVSLPEVGPWK